MNRISYRFFAQTIALLIVYALLNLLVSLKFLPGDITQTALPFPQLNELAFALLDLAIVGGLLGGGFYALIPPQMPIYPRLRITEWLWLLLVILTIAAGIFHWLITFGAILNFLKVVIIALVIAEIFPQNRQKTPIMLVWTVGMALSAACTLVALIPLSDFVLASVLHALTFGANLYIAQVLAAVALVYWLIGRFSTVSAFWAEMSLYTVAGLLTLAGALVTVSTLEPLGLTLGWGQTLIAAIVPLLTLIFASHTYLAFSNRNATNTLAAHWAALGVVLILFGIGMLGGLQATVQRWTAGTSLSDLQPILVELALMAVLLGVINQAVFEMRGQPRRVTGLAPFWLVAFGLIGGGLALAGAGLVQVYLERVIGVSSLQTQSLIAPLYGLWGLGSAQLTLGLLLYGLIHWLRRPRR